MPYKTKQETNAWQKARREKFRERVIGYLEEHPCVECGEADPVVLDFDHIDPKTKFKTVSRMLIGSCYSWERIEEEIGKCQVLCANCHRKKTHRDLNGWGASR